MTPPQLEASNSLSTESIVRWHIGDWEYLVELAAEDVAQHSDKCLIAMFKAAALFQQGLLDAARTWVNQAYSEKAIAVARRRCPSLNFHVKNLMLEGELDVFNADLFIILEVLEHIERDLDLIKSLPKGKIVIFFVPNMDSAGHVRFFRDIHEVENRYVGFCNINSAVTINLKGRSKIFLIHAVTK